MPTNNNVQQLRPDQQEPWGGFFPGDSARRPAEREWIVKDIIPWDEVVLLTGAPGAAKSKLLLQLQICAAIGGMQWIGRDVGQVRCLGLYMGEDDREEQERRCWDICEAYETDISLLGDQLELNPRLLSDKWMSSKLVDRALSGWSSFGRELWSIIEREFYKLIVIDTTTKALGWLAKRDGDLVDKLMQMFRQKCIENHCTVIFSDHTNKSDRKGFAGVNSLLAAVRAAMNIFIPNDKYHNPLRDKRVLHELRSSYSTWEPVRLKWENNILVLDDCIDESGDEGAASKQDDGVTVTGMIDAETEKAFKFWNGSKAEWLPKSQVQWNGADNTMTVPSWLAKKRGLTTS